MWRSLIYKQTPKTNQDFETKKVYTNNRYTIIWPQRFIFSLCLQGRSMERGRERGTFPSLSFASKSQNMHK